MNNKDFFSYIREFPHSLGIYLTYTIDREVITKIRENSSGRTIIIHDVKKGVILPDNYDCRVVCIPASIPNAFSNCFHSKMAILKGKENIRIITGSMNLTKASFSLRKEICYQTDIRPDSEQTLQVLELLRSINIPSQFHINLVEELESASKFQSISNDNQFINSVTNSISSVLIHYVEGIKEKPIVRILTPFVSSYLSTRYQTFIDAIDPKSLELYTRTSNKLPDVFKYGTPQISFYKPSGGLLKFHAKLVMLDYKEHVVVYIGSANFTEQGFFKSTIEGGNCECGCILEISDINEIESLRRLFRRGWIKESFEKWNENIDSDDKDELHEEIPYVFGCRNGKNCSLFVFLPNSESDTLKIKIEKYNYCSSEKKNNLYYFSIDNIPESKNVLKVIINSEVYELALFNIEKYNIWRQYDGDGLFSYQPSKLNSVNEKEVAEGTNKEGINIDTGGICIVEPPVLEQYYYNVKKELKFIESRQYFTKYHIKELNEKLEKQGGGTGIFFIMNLIKTFSIVKNKRKILMDEFLEICFIHLRRCLYDIDENHGKFNNFMKSWVQNG